MRCFGLKGATHFYSRAIRHAQKRRGQCRYLCLDILTVREDARIDVNHALHYAPIFRTQEAQWNQGVHFCAKIVIFAQTGQGDRNGHPLGLRPPLAEQVLHGQFDVILRQDFFNGTCL